MYTAEVRFALSDFLLKSWGCGKEIVFEILISSEVTIELQKSEPNNHVFKIHHFSWRNFLGTSVILFNDYLCHFAGVFQIVLALKWDLCKFRTFYSFSGNCTGIHLAEKLVSGLLFWFPCLHSFSLTSWIKSLFIPRYSFQRKLPSQICCMLTSQRLIASFF